VQTERVATPIRAPQPESGSGPQPTLIEPPAPNVAAELTKLANLHAKGMLTDEEFGVSTKLLKGCKVQRRWFMENGG